VTKVNYLSERLHQVFITTLENPNFQLEPTLKMGDTPQWDSFVHINLIIAIESEFGIEFDSAEIGNLLSVSQILNAITIKTMNR